jgi:hypothetical protein
MYERGERLRACSKRARARWGSSYLSRAVFISVARR